MTPTTPNYILVFVQARSYKRCHKKEGRCYKKVTSCEKVQECDILACSTTEGGIKKEDRHESPKKMKDPTRQGKEVTVNKSTCRNRNPTAASKKKKKQAEMCVTFHFLVTTQSCNPCPKVRQVHHQSSVASQGVASMQQLY